MIEHSHSLRVLYPETDKMGTVHHSNYARYYEVARWELFRAIGIPYNEIENAGYMLPVIKMNFRFIKTIQNDELLTIKTVLKEIKGVRIWFTYKLYNSQSELVNTAETELAFVCKENWKPCPPPEFVLSAIEKAYLI